ncbi:MAG: hypothetical protein AABW80_05050 [Nanoarchaeota archaeon]
MIDIPFWLDHKPRSIEVVCMGFPDEVLFDGTKLPEQRRIIEYAERNFERTIFFGHAYELNPHIPLIDKSKRVEVIGTCANTCVYNSALNLLRRGISVLIKPSLIMGQMRLSGIESEQQDREQNIEWLRKYLSEYGFYVRLNGEVLLADCAR